MRRDPADGMANPGGPDLIGKAYDQRVFHARKFPTNHVACGAFPLGGPTGAQPRPAASTAGAVRLAAGLIATYRVSCAGQP